MYQSAPGEPAPAADWPAGTSLVRSSTAKTLVLIVHPKCPCSRATIANLADLMARAEPGRLSVAVLFVRPPGVPAGWERTALWDAASTVAGVTVSSDDGGVEAARFGAVTSGQALLFDPSGRLRFRGGITPGRGHAGDSAGADAILALLTGTEAIDRAPVFGCPLTTPASPGERPTELTTCKR